MRIKQGSSTASTPNAAVNEATAGWRDAPQMVIAFSTATLEADEVARAFAARFPGSPVVGCTAAGEQLGGEHHKGSLAVVAIWDSSIRWATTVIEGLSTCKRAGTVLAVDGLLAELGCDRATFEPNDLFAMLLIDGRSMSEERITVLLAEALEGVPMAGGSAGDDLTFTRTQVYTEKGAQSDAAVVVLASKGNASVEIFKHQHYVTTPRSFCITKADTAKRQVIEIDGYPATEAYARALGLTPQDLTPEVVFLNPVTFSINGEIYVRSVLSLNPDGSMSFYCAIEEGMVLEIGSQTDMVKELESELARFTSGFGRADLLVGFNCILRALEAEKSGLHGALGSLLAANADSVIGFDTYGEQLNGMHINQTLVALAISENEGDR